MLRQIAPPDVLVALADVFPCPRIPQHLRLHAHYCAQAEVWEPWARAVLLQGYAPALFAASQTVSKHWFGTSKSAWATTVPTEAPPADLER